MKGQTLLATVFIFGLILLVGSISFVTIGVSQVEQKSNEIKGDRAYYGARAGIEEILYRLSTDPNFGATQSATLTGTTLPETTYIATISGNTETRIATASGLLGNKIRKIEVQLIASASAGNIALAYAAQVGQGGITMGNNAQIAGSGGVDGNVYSNGSIAANNGSKIIGNAWAVNGINPSGGGITITKNAYGSVIKNCIVNGNTYSPVLPTNCTVSGSQVITPAPSPIALPTIDIQYWQNAAAAGGAIASYSLTNGATGSLGPKKITGDITLSNSAVLTVTGALWVQGTFTIDNLAKVKLDNSFGTNGTVILLDHPTDKANNGRLIIQNNGSVIKTSQGGYILFISTNQSNDCSVKAATFSNNSANTAIVANDGCVLINNNGDLVALAARQLILNNNAEITYETGLSTELYVPGPGIGGSSGFGWQLNSWQEVP